VNQGSLILQADPFSTSFRTVTAEANGCDRAALAHLRLPSRSAIRRKRRAVTLYGEREAADYSPISWF
jgi:hypothetical protein